MQDSLVDPKRVLRRFVSKGGPNGLKKSKTEDGVVYVNEASAWQDDDQDLPNRYVDLLKWWNPLG